MPAPIVVAFYGLGLLAAGGLVAIAAHEVIDNWDEISETLQELWFRLKVKRAMRTAMFTSHRSHSLSASSSDSDEARSRQTGSASAFASDRVSDRHELRSRTERQRGRDDDKGIARSDLQGWSGEEIRHLVAKMAKEESIEMEAAQRVAQRIAREYGDSEGATIYEASTDLEASSAMISEGGRPPSASVISAPSESGDDTSQSETLDFTTTEEEAWDLDTVSIDSDNSSSDMDPSLLAYKRRQKR